MFWLLLFLAIAFLFVVLVAIPFLLGLFVAFLVWATPALKLKLWLAKTLVAGPHTLLHPEMGAEVATEVEWIVRERYGPAGQRHYYEELLEEVWEKPHEQFGSHDAFIHHVPQ